MRFRRYTVIVACALLAWGGASARGDAVLTEYYPVIMAGSSSPSLSPSDCPAKRVDPNTADSPFAGVGSFELVHGANTYLCTGVPISSRHVLTAAHALDVNYDGQIDFTPGNVTFNLNYGSDFSHAITAAQLAVHPGYPGFSFAEVTHDDIAIITLANDLPTGVPIYDLYTGQLPIGETLTMVGYGHSGYGDVGWEWDYRARFNVKRVGHNNADVFVQDDEGGPLNEVFMFDFDDPTVTDPLDPRNHWGGLSLGNDVETQLGFGDSGGPSFVFEDGEWKVAGINTFVASFMGGLDPPLFTSAGGGMLVGGYEQWITSTIPAPGALVLGAIGLAMVGWAKRRFG